MAEGKRIGKPRRASVVESESMAKEGLAEKGKKFISEAKTGEQKALGQERFKKAKISYRTIRVIRDNKEMIKVCKVEELPEGAYQSLAARIEKKKKSWIIKVGKLNDEMKAILKDREGIVL